MFPQTYNYVIQERSSNDFGFDEGARENTSDVQPRDLVPNINVCRLEVRYSERKKPIGRFEDISTGS